MSVHIFGTSCKSLWNIISLHILYIFTIAICRKAQDSLSPRNTSSQRSSRGSRSPGRKASSARNSSRNEDNLLLGSESSDSGQNKRRQSSEAEVKGLDRVFAPDHLEKLMIYMHMYIDLKQIWYKRCSPKSKQNFEALVISDAASQLFLGLLNI